MKIFKATILLCSILILSACNQDRIAELETENQKLKSQTLNKDSSINTMLSSFNKIQANLREIKKKEGFIELTTENQEGNKDLSQSIEADIEVISNLMQQNEQLVKNLNAQLKGSALKNDEFRKMITQLNERVKDKNQRIASLNDELREKKITIGQLYFSVDSLTFSNRQKENMIEEKVDKLNEVYYAIGTYKELKEKNVLTKEGGFLGLGKNEELKDNFNKEYFSRIDKRKQTSFLIYADKAELVTNHPTGSYEFMGKGGRADSLIVKNVEDFWRASNYLVIVVD